ncbi:motility associated factor glycosyltransferase family protein [Campylobacter concisus]|uniref:Motility accessory factor n=1 Tax=Campylobacter concisus TaxID=199 RepID=A0A2R4P281_9BACT|nr:6-hydroxymethylpterin diphosphokinase MptE-like protein [Campylobacter concisus]AVX44795.1 Motility accessory factor [Campylobacter concisus]
MSDENKVYKLDDLEVSKNKKTDNSKRKVLESNITNIENLIFQKNLQALFQQDEILAARLWSIVGNKDYEIFIGKDPIDINLINKHTFKYIYDNPDTDILKLLEDIEKGYKRYPMLFFYGLGNGILYKALAKNETHQKIVVIEPEIEIIYLVLNVVDLSNELASGQIILFYSKFATYTHFYYLVTEAKLNSYAKTYDLKVHAPFYDQYEEDYIRINKEITRAFSQIVVSHGNSIDDLLLGTRQNCENLASMIKNYCYTSLVKKRYGLMDTAIIVSTGPSLDKQLKTLKEFAPYATIISVDASYPILAKHDIAPDYVISMERVLPTSTFFEKVHPNIDKDIYFVVASVTHKQTIKNILPRRLVLTMRPQQEEQMFGIKRYGYLGIGHSCANMAYQLAYVLGHKNIVFIGQDLAFGKDGASHAKGHAFARADENLYVKAYGGVGEVRTTYVWTLFKNQFENDIAQSSLESIKSYNCTEGGARIEGTTERPFLDVMEELCKGKKVKTLPNIRKDSETTINKNLLKAYEVIKTKVKIQSQVKHQIEKVFLDVVPSIDKLLKLNNENKITEKHFNELLKITKKIDRLKDTIAKKSYQKYIENVIQISVYYQELELAKISVAPSDTKIQKVNKLLEWVEMHKYWMFSAAGGLNADIEVTKKASKPLVAELKKRKLITKNEIGNAKENFKLSI